MLQNMNSQIVPDNFSFFTPISDISKSKDKKGNEVMKIGGIASTNDWDADEESLDPNGFETDFFLSSGFFNWHHQSKTDPSAIVGEPTIAKITKGGLYVEGNLYPDRQKSRDIYDLAKSLKKSKSKRSLGFSIEGKVLERDPMNPAIIRRARITGCAITPTPKNPNTLMEIVKGHYNDGPLEFSPGTGNGGNTMIIDFTDEDGNSITVDKDFQIKIVKSATTSGTAGVLMPESLDNGDRKKIKKDCTVAEEAMVEKSSVDQLTSNDNGRTFNPTRNKSQVFERIFNHTDDIQKANKIYNLIHKLSKKMNTNSNNDNDFITEEDITKAFDALGLSDEVEKSGAYEPVENNNGDAGTAGTKSAAPANVEDNNGENGAGPKGTDVAQVEDNSNVEKADDEDEKDEDDGKSEVEKAMDKMYKAITAQMDNMYSMIEANGGIKNSEAVTTPATDTYKAESDDLNKGIESVELESVPGDTLSKADVAELIEKSQTETFKQNRTFMKALGTINKEVLDRMDDIVKSYGALETKVEEIATTPMPRKTIKNQAFIEKGFSDTPIKKAVDNSKTFDLRTRAGKSSLVELLDVKSGIEKGEYNEFYGNALLMLEGAGTISKAVATDLESGGYTVIQ